MSLTEEQWKEAFHRLAVIASYNDLTQPCVAGKDGTAWCEDTTKYDVEENAIAILDDETVMRWNESNSRLAEKIINRYDNGPVAR